MIDPDKDLDLHESEWSEEGKKQPIFGANARWFFLFVVPLFFLGLILHRFFSFLVIDVLGI